ncbi:hypothetical protein QTP70_002693, partial [Hemibagrus guttatus]
EHFYDPQSGSGYLAWRLMTVQRNTSPLCRKLSTSITDQDSPKRKHVNSSDLSPTLLLGWDSDLSSILLLVHLLPPTYKGHKNSAKISSYQAVNHVVRYLRIGTSVETFLAGVKSVYYINTRHGVVKT